MEEPTVFEVSVFADPDAGSITAVIEAFGSVSARPTVVGARGTAPLAETLIIGAVSVNALTYLVNSLRKSLRKGVIIDAFDSQLTIRQDQALPRGMVVVRAPGGDLTVQDGGDLGRDLGHALGALTEGRSGQSAGESAAGGVS